MKSVRYTTADGRISCELEAASPKAAFEAIASFQEVFEHTQCGLCTSKNVKFRVREDKEKHSYFEMFCHDCQARLDIGQNKDMSNLFPKTWDKEAKKPLPNGGWYIWQGDKEPSGPPTAAPAAQTPAKVAPDHLNGVAKGWYDWLEKDPTIEQLNKSLPSLKELTADTKKAVWGLIEDFARKGHLKFNDKAKVFETVPY